MISRCSSGSCGHAVSQDLCRTVETFNVPGSDKYANAIRKAMQEGSYLTGSTSVINYKSQIVTKRFLLERLATALDCLPVNTPLQKRTQVVGLSMPVRLRGVLLRSEVWINACGKINNILASFRGENKDPFDAPLPEVMNGAQKAHRGVVELLVGAHKNTIKKNYFSAAANLQLTAFGLQWHAAVSGHKRQLHRTKKY